MVSSAIDAVREMYLSVHMHKLMRFKKLNQTRNTGSAILIRTSATAFPKKLVPMVATKSFMISKKGLMVMILLKTLMIV